ncbi:hypothetical protein AB0B03_28635, partial [Micromonospora chalcea]
ATACRHRATLPVSPMEVMPPRRPQQTISNTLSDVEGARASGVWAIAYSTDEGQSFPISCGGRCDNEHG